MRRALKTAGKAVLWTLGALILFVLALLIDPRWALNTRTASWALRNLGKSERPRWSSLHLEVASPGLLTKRVVFEAADFCVDAADGSLKGCFPRLALDATLRLGVSPPVSVRRLERLVVDEKDLTLDETAAPAHRKEEKRKSGSFDLALVPRPLRRMTVGLIDVKIPRAVVVTATGTTTAKLAASFTEAGPAPLSADAEVAVATSAAAVRHYRAALTLDSDLWRSGSVSYLELNARASGDGGLRAQAEASAKDAGGGALDLKAVARASVAGASLSADASGRAAPDAVSARATLAVTRTAGLVRRLELRDCRLEAPLKKGQPTRADLSCGLAVVPAPFGKPLGSPPKDLAGKVSLHADFKRGSRFTAAFKADLAPRGGGRFFDARLEADLAGRTDRIPESLRARHRLDAGLTIERFADLVDYLKGTELAVPAPVNAFHGPVAVRVRTAGDSRGDSQDVDYRATTDLSSAKQKLKVEVTGRVHADGLFTDRLSLRDRTDVDLQDVVLQLPDVDLGKVPSPTVDKRIRTGDPKRDAAVDAARPQARKAASAPLDFDARVRTSQPVRLLTNLVPGRVPVALDLRARPNGLSGEIRLEPFDMKVFRQTGHIDHLTLKPSPGTSNMALDGKIVYKRPDVTVDILLVGSTEKPVVTFESTPPMTQNQIVAVLLYGKSPAELASDEQATAGTASSAFESGAFGLASLYLFASTPVEGVDYDAATKSYQVRFKLPGGTTLSVGSDLQESQSLALRKRVARNVEVETQLRQTQEQTGRRDAVTTFLQWFRGY